MEEDIKRHAHAFADWYAEAEKEARALVQARREAMVASENDDNSDASEGAAQPPERPVWLRSIAAFTPAPGMLHELPLCVGDELLLVTDQVPPDGWLIVRRRHAFHNTSVASNRNGMPWEHLPAGQAGLVPASFVEVTQDEEQSSSDDDVADPSAAPAAPRRMEHPAGEFAMSSGGSGLVELRRQCTSHGLPFSISDSWRTLVMRIAMDAAIADAAALFERSDGHDGVDDGVPSVASPTRGDGVPLLDCWLPVAECSPADYLIVKGSWLRTQTISDLALLDPSAAIHSGGFISTDELRRSHKGKPGDDAGDDVLPIPLIALRDLWVPPGGASTTTSGVDPFVRADSRDAEITELVALLLQALDAVFEKRHRSAAEKLEREKSLQEAFERAQQMRRSAEKRLRAAQKWERLANDELLGASARRKAAKLERRAAELERRTSDARLARIYDEAGANDGRHDAVERFKAVDASNRAHLAGQQELVAEEQFAVCRSAWYARQQAEAEAEVVFARALEAEERAAHECRLAAVVDPRTEWEDVALIMPRPLLPPQSRLSMLLGASASRRGARSRCSPPHSRRAECDSPRVHLARLRDRCEARRIEWSISDGVNDLEERLARLR